ncbi:MAG: leucyl/phenylalanyl-tRNA---protein transferase [Abditibacteriota bacterium]|nr:leucyl/phenylalanyl-tRNA---protein transferase [Abditibacteriota bacterium]
MLFPPVDFADEEGLIAIGGDLSVGTLLDAYRGGIFPWPVEGYPLLWFAPPERAILSFNEFHVARSLRKQMKSESYQVTIDTAFDEVLHACAAPRTYESETWILPPMIAAYNRLHRAGYAHSVEVWMDNELVGGLYGVSVGAYFAGESMFHRRSGASKIALVHLVQHLQTRGATWIDVQMPTPLFESFGACCISRGQFMMLLGQALEENCSLFGDAD